MVPHIVIDFLIFQKGGDCFSELVLYNIKKSFDIEKMMIGAVLSIQGQFF